MTPEQSRQIAAYLAGPWPARMEIRAALDLRRQLQAASEMADIPQPHRRRIRAIKGLATKGGPQDLQAPPLRP